LRYDRCIVLWMDADQAILEKRLDNRVDAMIRDGLMRELWQLHTITDQHYRQHYLTHNNDNNDDNDMSGDDSLNVLPQGSGRKTFLYGVMQVDWFVLIDWIDVFVFLIFKTRLGNRI
jgi:tRNA A37 N6-isopentenylltransferase MiaA